MERVLLISTAYPPPASAGMARVCRLLKWLPAVDFSPTLLTICRVALVKGRESLPEDPSNVVRVPCRPWRTCREGGRMLAGTVHSVSERKIGALRSGLTIARRLYYNIFEFPDSMRSWISKGASRGIHLCRNNSFQLLYSSSGGRSGVSSHFVASRIHTATGIPWIAEYRDLWVHNPWRTDKPYFWRSWQERRFESKFLNQAAGTVVVTEESRRILADRHEEAVRDRIWCVPNGFDASEYYDDTLPSTEMPLRVAYTGVLYGGKRDLRGFLRSLKMMEQDGSIKPGDLEFLYAGPEGPLVEAIARTTSTVGYVKNMGLLSPIAAKQLQRSCHILLLVEDADDNPTIKGSVPGKAYEYLAAGRLIIALAHPNGSIASLLKQTRTGAVMRPDDSAEIAVRLKNAMELLRSKSPLLEDRNLVEVNKYSWSVLSQKLAAVLRAAKCAH